MRNRAARVSVALVLVASGAWAAYTLPDLARRIVATDPSIRGIDELAAKVGELGMAQAGYVAPGQNPVPWLERFPVLIGEVSADAGRLSPRSGDAARELRRFVDEASTLAQSDASARDSLLVGDALTASHIIFGESRASIQSMQAALRSMAVFEAATLQSERGAALSRAATVLGVFGAIWVVGVVLLIPIGRGKAPVSSPAPGAFPDLERVAVLCGDIARVETPSQLQGLLDRSADVVGASGVVLWVGTRDQLFAVAAHGYDAAARAQMASLTRDADHPLTTAWRLGEQQIVENAAGAPLVLSPMIGPGGCSGVLAVEFRSGDTPPPTIAPVLTMIAAQLSTVVGGGAYQAAGVRATG